MTWNTPTLKQVRIMVRDDVVAALGLASMAGNSVLRVVSDTNAGLAHLVLRYIDWLARQLLPDTAETEWLDRHGDIWLVNADLSVGRKAAALAQGVATIAGNVGVSVPSGTILEATAAGVGYETTNSIVIGTLPTSVNVRALDGGVVGNREEGDVLSMLPPILNTSGEAVVVEVLGGTDEETDDELRTRVLLRIRQPPMGGDANDYVAWALAVAGVTRAWCSPLEMGPGTVTVRFMMDDLRAAQGGFPNVTDIQTVLDYINSQRPVAIKDLFVLAPLAFPISFTISELNPDTESIREAISLSVEDMLLRKAAPAYAINGLTQPAQTIYAAWISEAISDVDGVEWFDLNVGDYVMPNPGYLAVLGTISYAVD